MLGRGVAIVWDAPDIVGFVAVVSPLRLERLAADDFDVRPYLSMAAGLSGLANVIMQLSRPPVGYGVKESRVESGNVMVHPLKRARTTFTYLAVALIGDDADRRAFRRAVDHQHAQVRSDATSPVAYSAFDPDLQLWVAACLYYGLADARDRVGGRLSDETAEALYCYCARLGTTLQVRPEMWPPDRRAFRRYWEDALSQVSIDDDIRAYLMALVDLRNLPRPLRLALAPTNRFFTAGFLPPLFRTQMGLAWSRVDQDRFDRILRRIGRLEQLVPVAIRTLPFSALLLDMHVRQRLGLPLA